MTKRIEDQLPASVTALSSQQLYDLLDLVRVPTYTWNLLREMMGEGTAWTAGNRTIRGKQRFIYSPSELHKDLMRGILWNVLFKIPCNSACHGALPKTSIITNARAHAGRCKSVYVLDLKDAFPSVSSEKARAIVGPMISSYMAQSMGQLDNEERHLIATAIVDLCLPDGELPQGFPTSPQMLNLVLRPLDEQIARVMRDEADKTGVPHQYTRYVDDMTCSSGEGRFSNALRKRIRGTVVKADWVVNGKKVHHHTDSSSKVPVVTGIVIHADGTMTLPKRKINKYRGIYHQILERAAAGELTEEDRMQIRGVIGFVNMVYEGDVPSTIRRLHAEAKAKFGSDKTGGSEARPRRSP